MEEIRMMTPEQAEAARQERLSEVGTEPNCPFCGKARVRRSNYIRCNPCGVNWLNGEDISKDPRIQSHAEWTRTMATKRTETGNGSGAPPAA